MYYGGSMLNGKSICSLSKLRRDHLKSTLGTGVTSLLLGSYLDLAYTVKLTLKNWINSEL